MSSFLSKVSPKQEDVPPVEVCEKICTVREHLLAKEVPPPASALTVIEYLHARWMDLLQNRTTPGETNIQYKNILYFKIDPDYYNAEEACKNSQHPLVSEAIYGSDALKAAFYGLECYKWYPRLVMDLILLSDNVKPMETFEIDLEAEPDKYALFAPEHFTNVLQSLFPYGDGQVTETFFKSMELGDLYLRNYHPALDEPIDHTLPRFWKMIHVLIRSLNVNVGSVSYHPYDALVPLLIESAMALHPSMATKYTSISNYLFELSAESEELYRIPVAQLKLTDGYLGYTDNLEDPIGEGNYQQRTFDARKIRHLLKGTLGPRQIVDQRYFNTVVETLSDIHGGLGQYTPYYYVSTFVQYLGVGRWTQCPSACVQDAFMVALEATDDFDFGENTEADPFAEDTPPEDDPVAGRSNNDIGAEDTPQPSIIDEGGFPSNLEASAYADFLGRLRLLEALNRIIGNPTRYGYSPQAVQGMETLVAYHLWILPAADIARLLSTFIRIKDSLKK